MTAKRVAAIAIAAVLIVAALLIRNGLDDNSSSATNGTDKPSSGTITVICSTEFKAVCDELDSKKFTTKTEPAGTTLDDLTKAGADAPDAWITLDPFPGMVDDTRQRDNIDPLAPTVVAVAIDAPLLAIATQKATAFERGCAGGAAWHCLGGAAGGPWDELLAGEAGTVKVGIANPATEAQGLLTFGTAVAGYFGDTTFSSNSFTDDTRFSPWMRSMSEASGVSVDRPPLPTLITQPTAVNVAATTRSEADASPQLDKFTTFAIEPAFQDIAVVATFGSRANDVVSIAKSALTASGWVAASDTKPQLPAGTFIALRKLWKDYNK